MTDDTEHDESAINVVQDAELLLESVREMTHLSTGTTTTRAMADLLGNLAKAGHLLPEALNELSDHLEPATQVDGTPATDSAGAAAAVDEARSQMQQAADLALQAGICLRAAQRALEGIR